MLGNICVFNRVWKGPDTEEGKFQYLEEVIHTINLLKVKFPETWGEGKRGKADPYQLIKKNEITVDKEGKFTNLRSCGHSRSPSID